MKDDNGRRLLYMDLWGWLLLSTSVLCIHMEMTREFLPLLFRAKATLSFRHSISSPTLVLNATSTTVFLSVRQGYLLRFVPQASFCEIKLCWTTALKPNIPNQTEFLRKPEVRPETVRCRYSFVHYGDQVVSCKKCAKFLYFFDLWLSAYNGKPRGCWKLNIKC